MYNKFTDTYKRIKTKRVNNLIDDCKYWLYSKEKELFLESVNTLINAAGKDHPLVKQFMNLPSVSNFYTECKAFLKRNKYVH